MTIIIGLKTEEYGILIADCQITDLNGRQKNILSNKIRYGADTSSPSQNGIYVAHSGFVN